VIIYSISGSSTSKETSNEYNIAFRIGEYLAKNDIHIATGGYGGIMEAAAKGAVLYNVRRIGVTCPNHSNRMPNPYINEEIVTPTYLERLQKLIEISDGYIVLPGGTGTLLELSAIWALTERKIIKEKPIICIGEQWGELWQLFAYYNETVVDNPSLLRIVNSYDEAILCIDNSINSF